MNRLSLEELVALDAALVHCLSGGPPLFDRDALRRVHVLVHALLDGDDDGALDLRGELDAIHRELAAQSKMLAENTRRLLEVAARTGQAADETGVLAGRTGEIAGRVAC